MGWNKSGTYRRNGGACSEILRCAVRRGKEASIVGNIVFALKHYCSFIGKELDLKPPKQRVKQVDFLTFWEVKNLLYKIDNFTVYTMVQIMLYSFDAVHKEFRFAQFHIVQTFILDQHANKLSDAVTKTVQEVDSI